MGVDWVVILVAIRGELVNDHLRCQNDFDVSVVNAIKRLESQLVKTLDIVESVIKKVNLLEKKGIDLRQF